MQPPSTNGPVRTTSQTATGFVGLDILADYACTQRQLEIDNQQQQQQPVNAKPTQKLQKVTKAASQKKQQQAAAVSPNVSIPRIAATSPQQSPPREEEKAVASTPSPEQLLCDLVPPYFLSSSMEEAVAELSPSILYRPLAIQDFQVPEIVVTTNEPVVIVTLGLPPSPTTNQPQEEEVELIPTNNITPPLPLPFDQSGWSKRTVAAALTQLETTPPTSLVDMDLLAAAAIELLEFVSSKRMSNAMLETLLVMTRTNMKHMYDSSGDAEFIWCDRKKRGELRDERMHWLLLRAAQGNNNHAVVGFAAFKLCTEKGVPHAYLHELQIIPERKGQGLGTILINALIRLCIQLGIPLILLTVFSSNLAAIDFYLKCGFEVDECSPSMCFNIDKANPAPYEIMSMTLDFTVICPYKCTVPECDFVFRFEDSLEHHQCEVHGAAWPVPCPHCPRGVLTEDQLHRHCELMQTHPNPLTIEREVAAVDTRRNVHPRAAEMLYTRVRVIPCGKWGLVVKITDKNMWHVRMDGEVYQVRGLRARQIEGLSKRPSLLNQINDENDGDDHVNSTEEAEDNAAATPPQRKQRVRQRSPKRKAAVAVASESSSHEDESGSHSSSSSDGDGNGREFRRSKRLVDNPLVGGKRRSSRHKKQICYREPKADTYE